MLVAQSCPTLATPWTAVHLAPLSLGFSRQGYWHELLFPPPGNLPESRTDPVSLALQVDSVAFQPPGKPEPFQKACITRHREAPLFRWVTKRVKNLKSKAMQMSEYVVATYVPPGYIQDGFLSWGGSWSSVWESGGLGCVKGRTNEAGTWAGTGQWHPADFEFAQNKAINCYTVSVFPASRSSFTYHHFH